MAGGGLLAKRRAGRLWGELAGAEAAGGGAALGRAGHGSAGALAGAATCCSMLQRRLLASAVVLFWLFHGAASSAGQGLGLELEQAGSLPSDHTPEELDSRYDTANKGLKGLAGKAHGGAGGEARGDREWTPEKSEGVVHGSHHKRAERSILEFEEDDACSVPRPVRQCRLHPGERIHLVFVSAMWNRDRHTKEETANVLKSILFGTRCRLHIHFIVSGEPEVSAITAMMDSVPAPHVKPVPSPLISGTDLETLSPVERQGYAMDQAGGVPGLQPEVVFSLHFIPEEWVLERTKGLDMFPFDHHAGIPGMAKFFLPEILWQVRTAIYMDVDMLMAGDIQDLHDYIQEMERDQQLLYYMSNTQPLLKWKDFFQQPSGQGLNQLRNPYCSCLMVLHLERMRNANMSKLFLSTLKGHMPPRKLAEYSPVGDQYLFMRTCKELKHVCRILPWMWDVAGCQLPVPFMGLNARGREVNGSCWQVVHFNCVWHGRESQEGHYRVPTGWKEAYNWASQLSFSDVATHRSNM